MEAKMIIEESINRDFQIVEKVFLDEFNPKNIRKVEMSLRDVDLQKIK